MSRIVALVLLLTAPVLAGDPALDVKCKEIAKKLATPPRLTEFSLKPFQSAADEVRVHFFRDYDVVRLADENRAFFCSIVAKKDANEEVRLGAIRWLGRLGTSKTATKALADLLADKNVTIRAAAIASLGGHRDPTLGARFGKLLNDETPEIRHAAIVALGKLGDRKQLPTILQAYKKHAANDETDAPYGEALSALGETDVSLKIAMLGIKSRDYATRLSAVRALEYNPSLKVIPVFMENLVLELRRTIALDPKKADWDVIYVTMCSELQRRTGKGIGNDAVGWYDWWATVRAQYMSPDPAIDFPRLEMWMDQYRKMGPTKLRG